MKTRNGFVSNSSSASFVIAFEDRDKCPTCGHSPMNLITLLDMSYCDYNSESTEIKSRNYEETLKSIRDGDIYVNEEEQEALIEKINQFQKEYQNWEIIACSICYNSPLVDKFIKEKTENGSLITLWGDEIEN